ncbi:MAG: ClpXP protease specificity-enhancing factor [Burkholderiaceae bacterium]
MPETSTKPYLLRAIYEWCTDNGYTPYLAAMVDANTRVPMQFVKNGEIVLNISFEATSGLKLDNDSIHFSARFGGVARDVLVPVDNVIAIYARENGQGMAFEVSKLTPSPAEEPAPASVQAPTLASVPPPAPEPEGEPDGGSDNEPEPPKKGGRPTLTRIK